MHALQRASAALTYHRRTPVGKQAGPDGTVVFLGRPETISFRPSLKPQMIGDRARRSWSVAGNAMIVSAQIIFLRSPDSRLSSHEVFSL